MHHISNAWKPVARNICYQRPLNIRQIQYLLEDHADNPKTLDDLRTSLHSVCNGYENFLIANSLNNFRSTTPEKVAAEIEKSIYYAHYKTKARGSLYALLATVTSATALTLGLKSADTHFVQEAIAHQGLVIGSIGSLTHSTHYTLTNAYDDLINTNQNIETNIIFNTATLRDYLKKTEPEL